jgi:hypothetical protein
MGHLVLLLKRRTLCFAFMGLCITCKSVCVVIVLFDRLTKGGNWEEVEYENSCTQAEYPQIVPVAAVGKDDKKGGKKATPWDGGAKQPPAPADAAVPNPSGPCPFLPAGLAKKLNPIVFTPIKVRHLYIVLELCYLSHTSVQRLQGSAFCMERDGDMALNCSTSP